MWPSGNVTNKQHVTLVLVQSGFKSWLKIEYLLLLKLCPKKRLIKNKKKNY